MFGKSVVSVDDGGSEVDEFAVGDAGLLAQSGARTPMTRCVRGVNRTSRGRRRGKPRGPTEHRRAEQTRQRLVGSAPMLTSANAGGARR